MPETRTGNPAAERTLLARHADVLVTMDDARREIPDGALFVRGNRIEQVGATADLPPTADEVIDLSGHVLLPGLVNTHHHMFQTLTRVGPGGAGRRALRLAESALSDLGTARRRMPSAFRR